MKKIRNIVCLFVAMLLVGTLNVNAMSKDELKAKLTKAYTINGATFQATSDQKVEIERYLSQNNVSESDADYIASKIDEAVAIIERGNANSFEKLTKAEKNEIKALLTEVSNNTSVKVTAVKNGVKVYNLDGTVFTVVTASKVKYTDTYMIIALAGVVSIIGIAVIARKMKKANA